MSDHGAGKRYVPYTFDKFLLEVLKPAYFGLIGFLKRIALLAVFIGLVGYTLSQIKAQGVDLIKLIFHSNPRSIIPGK